MLKIPLVYLSPRVSFLDDNKCFLESIYDSINQEFYIKIFDSTSLFLQKIVDSDIFYGIFCSFNKEEAYLYDQSVVSLDISKTPAAIFDLFRRKKPITVAFIDYQMPAENGVSICTKLTKTFVKKVFLTGELCEEEVIESFNKNIIDGYINKNNNNLAEEVKNMTLSLHSSYLKNINNVFAPFIMKDENLVHLYNDQDFLNIYEEFLKRNNISYSSIYDFCGSQVMLDKDDNVFYINVYNMEEIKFILLPALVENNLLSEDIRESLNKFDTILDYKCVDSLQIPDLECWNQYLTDDFSVIKSEKTTYFVSLKGQVKKT